MTHYLARPGNFRRQFLWDTNVIPAVVLLIVAITLAWVTYGDYERAQEAEYRLLAAHARNTDRKITDTLEQVERLLSHIAAERLKYSTLPHKSFAALLNRQWQEVPALGTLLITDSAGRIRAATDATLIGRDVSAESYFVAQRDGWPSAKLFLSRPDQHLLDATAAVFTLPIMGPNHTFIGIVGVSIGFDFFPRILQTINPDDSASMTVVFNRSGDLLFRRADPEKYFGFNIIKDSKVLNAHIQAGERTTRHIGPSHINGKTRLFLVRDIGNNELGLILSRQLDEVLAQWRRNVAVYILIFVFTTVLVTFLASVAARRKREIQAGKEFTDLLIATANVIVIGVDTTGRISIFNETAERILGYRRDEVLGRDWLGLTAAKQTSTGARAMFDAFRSGGALPHSAEYPIITKGGEEHIIAWQNSVIPEPRAAISFGIDVTERKRMEDALALAKQGAEEANRAKSRFLAAASHDLRQPIQALGLFIGALHALAQRPQINGADVEHIATRLQSASHGLSNLLNELLDISRLDAGTIRAEKRPVALTEKLATLHNAFSGPATEKGIELRIAPCSLWVDTDPTLLYRILANLVANALRYTQHGRVLVGCRRHTGTVTLQVWDTGIGIPDDQLANIFEEFFQADNTKHHRAQEQEQGLGLGLSIVQRCAVLLGTQVRVCSTPGHGSMFWLELPIAAVLPALSVSGRP